MKRLILATAATVALALGAIGTARAQGPDDPVLIRTVVIGGVVLGVPPGYGGGVQPIVTLGTPPGFGGHPVPMSGCLVLGVPPGFGGGERVVCP